MTEIAYHRNGISGEGFHVVKFDAYNPFEMMVAVVFEAPGHVAVFNRGLLGKGEIRFTKNSYRGDHFETMLREAIHEQRDNPAVYGPVSDEHPPSPSYRCLH